MAVLTGFQKDCVRTTKNRLRSGCKSGLKGWFKSGAVGVNNLNGLMKTMVEKAGIKNDRLRNHNGGKTMIQTLSEHKLSKFPRNARSAKTTRSVALRTISAVVKYDAILLPFEKLSLEFILF